MFLETKRNGETTTKPDIYELPTLIAWLEKQPKDGTYRFTDIDGRCLISQYIEANGKNWSHHYLRLTLRMGDGFASEMPWTFGAALGRARAALDKSLSEVS